MNPEKREGIEPKKEFAERFSEQLDQIAQELEQSGQGTEKDIVQLKKAAESVRFEAEKYSTYLRQNLNDEIFKTNREKYRRASQDVAAFEPRLVILSETIYDKDKKLKDDKNSMSEQGLNFVFQKLRILKENQSFSKDLLSRWKNLKSETDKNLISESSFNEQAYAPIAFNPNGGTAEDGIVLMAQKQQRFFDQNDQKEKIRDAVEIQILEWQLDEEVLGHRRYTP